MKLKTEESLNPKIELFVSKGSEGGVVCRCCGRDMELTESFGDRSGIVSRITVKCKKRNCQNSIPLSNNKLAEAQKLNRSVILGGLVSGIGR